MTVVNQPRRCSFSFSRRLGVSAVNLLFGSGYAGLGSVRSGATSTATQSGLSIAPTICPRTPILEKDLARAAFRGTTHGSVSLFHLDRIRRDAILEAIQGVCAHRGWNLLAAHVLPSTNVGRFVSCGVGILQGLTCSMWTRVSLSASTLGSASMSVTTQICASFDEHHQPLVWSLAVRTAPVTLSRPPTAVKPKKPFSVPTLPHKQLKPFQQHPHPAARPASLPLLP